MQPDITQRLEQLDDDPCGVCCRKSEDMLGPDHCVGCQLDEVRSLVLSGMVHSRHEARHKILLELTGVELHALVRFVETEAEKKEPTT